MASAYWDPSPNYTSGNQGRLYLFPHWTAGGFAGSVSTLKNPSRQASAHYVIEGDTIAQLVSENDTAWHCGNAWYNARSISYELVGWPGNPPSKATLNSAAEQMAKDSRKFFGGAKLVLGGNVLLHKMVSATSCPGETDIPYLIDKANELLGYGNKDGWKYSNGWGWLRNGLWVYDEWIKSADRWYYVDKTGTMAEGWHYLKWSGGKDWFYFWPKDGNMALGWLKCKNGWYYLDPTTGAMAKGWQKIGKYWFYLDSSGKMLDGIQTIGGQVYCFDSSGVCRGTVTPLPVSFAG